MSNLDGNDWIADLEEDRKQVIPEDNKIRMLTNLADHYASLENEIALTEQGLKILQERFRLLREDIIPDKMKEFGIKKLVLADGSTIAYRPFYAGKILDEKAYDWLEENGYADAVKQELRLEVSRVDSQLLNGVMALLVANDLTTNMSIKEKQSIHHMTLGSTIKELTKRGKELPPELIETFIGDRASLTKGKSDE